LSCICITGSTEIGFHNYIPHLFVRELFIITKSKLDIVYYTEENYWVKVTNIIVKWTHRIVNFTNEIVIKATKKYTLLF